MSPADELPVLTRAESKIMRVVWKRGRATVHEVLEDLSSDAAYTTVLTVLKVLERKGYIRHEAHTESKRAHVFVPVLSESQARQHHARDLVDRLFDGRPNALVNGILDGERLSKNELRLLRERIETLLGEKGRRQ